MPIDTRTARMDLVFSLAERFRGVANLPGSGGGIPHRCVWLKQSTLLIERLRKVLVAVAPRNGRY